MTAKQAVSRNRLTSQIAPCTPLWVVQTLRAAPFSDKPPNNVAIHTAAIIAAIVAQLSSSLSFAGRSSTTDTGNVLINFFSYFTIDSNVLTVIILLIGAAVLMRGAKAETHRFTVTRVAVTTYMIITGLVYNLLLRGLLVQGATVAWSNEILHVVGPMYLVIDWFLAPGRNRLAWRNALPALVFPIIWVIYTLVRGPLATDP